MWQLQASYHYYDLLKQHRLTVERQFAIKRRHDNKTVFVMDEEKGKPKKRCPRIEGVGGKPIPYRLPELAEALKKRETICVVEGENKVEVLRERGIAATCCAGGAYAWTDDHADWLLNATDVVIIPDNDDQGRHYANCVGNTVKAQKLRLLELPDLPEHGDVVDWLVNGGDADQLKELISKAPEWKPSGNGATQHARPKEADGSIPTWKHGDEVPPPTRWLIRNRLPETGVALISGQWGTGKTFVWIDCAGAVMTGKPWLMEPVYRKGGILAFKPEGAASIPMRVAALTEHKLGQNLLTARLPFERAVWCPTLLMEKDSLKLMVATANAAAARFKESSQLPLSMIVLDTAMAGIGWKDEDDNSEVVKAWSLLRQLSDETGALVVVVDHFGKNQIAGTRGGSAKEANSDTVLALLCEKEASGAVADPYLAIRKSRDGPQGAEFAYRLAEVPMGQDDTGLPLTQIIVDWNVERVPATKKKGRPSQTESRLAEAIAAVEPVRLSVDGAEVDAYPEKLIKHAFIKQFVGHPDSARKAWNRAKTSDEYKNQWSLAEGEIYLTMTRRV
jgi:hypothetical protein